LFPDVIAALESLSDRGVPMGIVSNFDGRLVRICEGLRLVPFFETVMMSARAGYAKPDARIFRAALETLGVATAAEALHVGDSVEEDVRGAQAAGLRACSSIAVGRGSEG
jgi:putative hydrolase of the HAD superfamily